MAILFLFLQVLELVLLFTLCHSSSSSSYSVFIRCCPCNNNVYHAVITNVLSFIFVVSVVTGNMVVGYARIRTIILFGTALELLLVLCISVTSDIAKQVTFPYGVEFKLDEKGFTSQKSSPK